MERSKLWSKHGLKMVPFVIEYMILYIIRARTYQNNIRSVNSGQGVK